MALGSHIPPALKKEAGPETHIKNPGGIKAPSGPSVAGNMVKNARNQRRGNKPVPKTPGRRPQHQGGRAPAAPKSQPYNALESPFKTRQEEEANVAASAKSQYQPELNSIGTEKAQEEGLHATRQGDNVAEYNAYTQQAQEHYNTAKESLAEIASHASAATGQAQEVLQGALSNTGVSGLPGVANPDAFLKEAASVGGNATNSLAKEQTSIMGELGANLAIPGVARTEAESAENQRHEGAANKLQLEERKAQANIPNIIARTKEQANKEEQAREANRLQAGIAQKKFGLEKQGQLAEQHLKGQELHQKREEAREANKLKIQEIAKSSGFEEQKLDLERKKIDQEIAEARGKGAKEKAELAGKRWDHGLELMAGIFKIDPKTEWTPFRGETPEQRKQYLEEHKTPHQVNPEHLYQVLTKQGNLTAPEAFRIMSSTGNQAVMEYAAQHLKTFEAGELLNKARQKPFTPMHPAGRHR